VAAACEQASRASSGEKEAQSGTDHIQPGQDRLPCQPEHSGGTPNRNPYMLEENQAFATRDPLSQQSVTVEGDAAGESEESDHMQRPARDQRARDGGQ